MLVVTLYIDACSRRMLMRRNRKIIIVQQKKRPKQRARLPFVHILPWCSYRHCRMELDVLRNARTSAYAPALIVPPRGQLDHSLLAHGHGHRILSVAITIPQPGGALLCATGGIILIAGSSVPGLVVWSVCVLLLLLDLVRVEGRILVLLRVLAVRIRVAVCRHSG